MAEAEKSDEIWVSMGVTINTGNYSSYKVDAGKRIVIQKDETDDQAWERLWSDVDNQLSEKVAEAKADLEKR